MKKTIRQLSCICYYVYLDEGNNEIYYNCKYRTDFDMFNCVYDKLYSLLLTCEKNIKNEKNLHIYKIYERHYQKKKVMMMIMKIIKISYQNIKT
jgi:hypothetical protein